MIFARELNMSFIFNNLKLNTKKKFPPENSFFQSKKYFQHRLDIEKQRSDRTHEPISVVVLNLKEVVNELNFRLYEDSRNVLAEIGNQVFTTIRSIDVAAWYDSITITIILCDCSFNQAHNFIKRMNLRLHQFFIQKYSEDTSILDKIKISVFTYPDDYENGNPGKAKETRIFAFDQIEHDQLNGQFSKTTSTKRQHFLKRGFDLIFALVAFIMLLPIGVIIGSLIKLTSSGPVFFKQERIGCGCKNFNIFKFRTMYCDADQFLHEKHILNLTNENYTGTFKIEDDKRITPLGKFLRKYYLDELPQLINVIKGDMSIVGPRPHPVYEVKEYTEWYKRRLAVKPGITGLWQVRGDKHIHYRDAIRMDLSYIDNWSLVMDLKIIFNTIPTAIAK